MIAAPVQCDVDGIPKGVALRKCTVDQVTVDPSYRTGEDTRTQSKLRRGGSHVLIPGTLLPVRLVLPSATICVGSTPSRQRSGGWMGDRRAARRWALFRGGSRPAV